MRNSALPIPWTHRDSRPKTQAELDEEERFDLFKETHLRAPRGRSDLVILLDHCQEMFTRMLEDPNYVHRIDLATDYNERQKEKRKEEGRRLAQEKAKRDLYKEPKEPKPREYKYADEDLPKPRKPREEPKPPAPYFQYLNEVFEEEGVDAISAACAAPERYRPAIYNDHDQVVLELEKAGDPSVLAQLSRLRRDYLLTTDAKLWEAWKPRLYQFVRL